MAKKKPVAYLIRHGAALHEDELMAGRGCDFPLSDEGEAQAAKLSKFLKTIDFGCVLCSPLLRAVQTAEISLAPLGGRCIEQTRDLFPWSLGPQFDGEEKKSREEDLAWLIAHPDEAPLHGVSLNDFKDDLSRFLECHFNPFAPPLLFTHSNVICVTKDLVLGTEKACPGLEEGVTPTGVIAIYGSEGEGDDFKILYGSEA
jgi:broad specificity phosphatase PhoE